MIKQKINDIATDTLVELKAADIKVIDVRSMTAITDTMIVASGRSTRHVKSIAQNLMRKIKQNNYELVGIEGEHSAEWILVDFGDLVAHIMLPEIRSFYSLEKLWTIERNEALLQ